MSKTRRANKHMTKMKRAYTYRFYPTDTQARTLAQTFGCTRFVSNFALSKRKRAYFDQGVKLSTKDVSAAISPLKKEEGTTWVRDVSSVALQQALRQLDAAYTTFFEGRTDYPTFKKKHHAQSATYTDNAFLVEEGIGTRPLITTAVGIDGGLKALLVTSDGEMIANRKDYAHDEKKLAKAQRKQARKNKGSKNRTKARHKVARLHARIADTRRDFQHKASTKLIGENQVLGLETLNIKGMLKNHRLAKAISDVGWREFTRQLEDKANCYGRTLVKIDRWYPSSKTCSDCGYVLDTLLLDVREWICPCCGTWHDRDSNAASNILAAGLVATDCGGNGRRDGAKVSHAVSVEAVNPHGEVGNPLPF
jgi:putative transposase